MKALIFFFFCLSSFVAGAQKLPYDPHEYIEWNEFYKLSWDAFTAQADDAIFGDAGTVVKIIAEPYLVGREVHYDVYALFNKKKSWCHEKSDKLLIHEQLHFDIAELTARQIRKKVEELRNKKIRDAQIFNAEVNKIIQESNKLDDLYDKETLHGVYQDKQHEWEQTIMKDLNSLSPYSRASLKISKH